MAAWFSAMHKFPQSALARDGFDQALSRFDRAHQAYTELLRFREQASPELLDQIEHGLGMVAFREKRLSDAIAHFEHALLSNPARQSTRLKLVEALFAQGSYRSVVNEGLALLTDPPPSELPPYALLVTSALRCSRESVATHVLNEFCHHIRRDAKKANQRTGEIVGAFAQCSAIDLLLQALQESQIVNEKNPDLAWLQVSALVAAGYQRQAAQCCAKLRDIYPEKAQFLRQHARLLNRIQDWSHAGKAWKAVLADNPRLPEAMAQLSYTLVQTGQAVRSVERMASLLEKDDIRDEALEGALLYARLTGRLLSARVLNSLVFEKETKAGEQVKLMLEQQELNHQLGLRVEDLESIRAHVTEFSEPGSALQQRLETLESRVSMSSIRQASMHSRELSEPVDVVYTWVDGSDPVWLEKFRQYTDIDLWENTDNSKNWCRYESFSEIIFSLRTLDRYFPEARKIFIVTDRQSFDVSVLPQSVRQKIRFIDHTEIIPENQVSLPTFVSDVIEAFLDRIPGISETFLYFNDDMFLGRPLSPSDIFDENGRPIQTIISRSWPDDKTILKRRVDSIRTDTSNSRTVNTLELFESRLGVSPWFGDDHLFRVRTRTQYRYMMEIFGQDLKERLFQHRVRERNSVRTCQLLDWIAGVKETHTLIDSDRTVRSGFLAFTDLDWEHVTIIMKLRPRGFCINVTPERRDRFEFLAQHFLDFASGGWDASSMIRDPFLNACLEAASTRGLCLDALFRHEPHHVLSNNVSPFISLKDGGSSDLKYCVQRKLQQLSNHSGNKALGKKLFAQQQLELAPFKAVSFSGWGDWEQDPFNNRSWQWRLNWLSFLSYLMAYHRASDDEAVLDSAREAIQSWLDAYLETDTNYRFEFIWHDHATALRAEQLVLFAYYCREYAPEWASKHGEFLTTLEQALMVHGQWLAKDSFYSEHTNHGLEQARVLLLLGTVFEGEQAREWQQIAIGCISSKLNFAFTDEGLLGENSLAGHIFVFKVFLGIIKDYPAGVLGELADQFSQLQEESDHLTQRIQALEQAAELEQTIVAGLPADDHHPERALGLDFSLPEEQGKDKH
ncbi:Stealth CR1 domain-containing protein [Vreelandella aquamarina]|uniref:Stealth CR1 domain-containing protein n=1 Tax=Vreelandella aquamarina TaxID=77097 RepID=UPI00384B8B52